MPAIIVLTGASGAGKTTLISKLAEKEIAGVACINCDRVKLPDGSVEGAQVEHWVLELSQDPNIKLAVLDTQIRPHLALEVLDKLGVTRASVVLVDCDHDKRHERLNGPRGQPELVNPQMDCWAAYLRGQADALGLPRIDTNSAPINESVDQLFDLVLKLLASPSSAPPNS